MREKYAVVAAAIDADSAEERGWVSPPSPHLRYVPSRLIPKNVAEQRKWKLDDAGNLSEVVKDRVTTDDSVELDDGELGSHNNTLPRDDWPDTKLLGPYPGPGH